MPFTLTDEIWAIGLAERFASEIGLPKGNYWVPPTARKLEETASKYGRKAAESEARLRFGLED